MGLSLLITCNPKNMLNSLFKRDEGVAGALSYDPVAEGVLCACTAIAWAYTIELDLLILYTFRRRTGLYFWALLISSWGCSLHALAFILKFLVGAKSYITLLFIEVGESRQQLLLSIERKSF